MSRTVFERNIIFSHKQITDYSINVILPASIVHIILLEYTQVVYKMYYKYHNHILKYISFLCHLISWIWNRTGQGFVDECVSEINQISERGELTENKFLFMTYLLSRPELTYKDISIITLSLFGDGLNTVSTANSRTYVMYNNNKNKDSFEIRSQGFWLALAYNVYTCLGLCG